MEPRPFPAILAPWRGDLSEPMQVQGLKITVIVVGNLATTTWDMTVHNPQGRVLEGELLFPLGEGQTVSRFAMDVNGRLREGVVVEKEKGRQVFEDIVRRGVDPGLLEKTAGNSFRARIYPIPAHGHKRVVLAYEQELPRVAEGEKDDLLYQLPLNFESAVETFSLRVEVLDQPQQPQLQSSPMANFQFKAWRQAFIAEETRRDFVPDQPLSFVVPRMEDAVGTYVERREGQDYFYLSLAPHLKVEAKTLPKSLGLVWDASGSARNRVIEKEFEVLGAYLKKIGSCRVELIIFRNEAEAPKSFNIQHGQWTELRAALEDAPQDGGTHLGCLDLEALKVEELLLFSDGIHTFGSGESRFPDVPVIILNSALAAEHAQLRALAESHGGQYLNLALLSAEQALADLQERPAVLVRVEDPDEALEQCVPNGSCQVGRVLGLAGILKKSKATLKLHFGYGRKARWSRTIHIDVAQARVEAPVARIWAQKRLQELERDKLHNREKILELGQRFGIVTEETSLIVLDSVEDYLRYRIQPPEELRKEYEQNLHRIHSVEAQDLKAHLNAVVQQYEERIQWWHTDFKPAPPQPKLMKNAEVGRSLGAGMPPPPPAMPSPAPMMAMPTAPVPMMARAAAAPPEAAPMVDSDHFMESEEAAPPEAAPEAPRGTIELKAWSPDTPYTRMLKAAKPRERYSLYLLMCAEWGKTPGFFLDVAELFREWGEESLALRILSNLAELKLESHTLLRVLGYRLKQLSRLELAKWCLEEVRRMRADEPQSHRDLALTCAELGEYQRAVELLWHVVKSKWDPRFRDVNLIACGEMNAILASSQEKVNTKDIDGRLLRNLPVDVRVVLNWDTDNSDMDLHVLDPRGEECYYSHPRTEIGGRISADVTQGYGPEEFLLKKAVKGTYAVRAKFFGTREQTIIGATTVILELYLHYGTPQALNKSLTLRLDGPGRMVDIGEFLFEND